MEIIFNINAEEIKRVKFRTRLIDDRQDRPGYYMPSVGHFDQSYCGDHRRDMFWINCYLDGNDLGAFSIAPSLKDESKFILKKNHSKVSEGYNTLAAKAHHWFSLTPEYQQQILWVRELIKKIKKDEEVGFKDILIK